MLIVFGIFTAIIGGTGYFIYWMVDNDWKGVYCLVVYYSESEWMGIWVSLYRTQIALGYVSQWGESLTSHGETAETRFSLCNFI